MMKRSKRKKRRSQESGGARNVQHRGRLVLVLVLLLVLVLVLVLVLKVVEARRQPDGLCSETIETSEDETVFLLLFLLLFLFMFFFLLLFCLTGCWQTLSRKASKRTEF